LKYVLTLMLLCSAGVNAQTIFSCIGHNGKKVYTDSKLNCKAFGGKVDAEVETITFDSINMHSQYGATVSEEYYNYAFRAYEKIPGYTINIIAESKLIQNHPQLLQQSASKLDKTIVRAISTFPVHAQPEFDGIKYFIFSGNESRKGGRRGGQWYFREGNSISDRFDNAIVVRSAKDYLERYSEKRALMTAVHELSHAYYYYHWKNIYRSVNKAYKNTVEQGRYRNVKTKSGKVIAKAYALTNEREYFAELSKIIHVGNYYYPFDGGELREYDPEGYQAVRLAFGYQ